MSFHYIHYTTPQLQLQLQLHYTNYATLQLQLHYATTRTTATLQHTTASSCGWGDHCKHCKHSKKHDSNHFPVHQWNRSAIHASQQLTSPIFETSATALCGTTGIYSHKRNLNCTATQTRNDGALDILNPPQHPSTNWTLIQNQNLCIFGADWNCFCS